MTPPSPNFARTDRIDCIERFSTGNRVRSTSRAKEATDVRCVPVQILEIVWETRRGESGDLGIRSILKRETEKCCLQKYRNEIGRFSVFVSYFVSQCVRRMREWDENFSKTKKSVVKEQFSTRPITLQRNSICAQSQATRKTKESARLKNDDSVEENP